MNQDDIRAAAKIAAENAAFNESCRSLCPQDRARFEQMLTGYIFCRPEDEGMLFTIGVRNTARKVANATRVVQQPGAGFVRLEETAFFRCEDPVILVARTTKL